jgi:hypothetical protein
LKSKIYLLHKTCLECVRTVAEELGAMVEAPAAQPQAASK